MVNSKCDSNLVPPPRPRLANESRNISAAGKVDREEGKVEEMFRGLTCSIVGGIVGERPKSLKGRQISNIGMSPVLSGGGGGTNRRGERKSANT